MERLVALLLLVVALSPARAAEPPDPAVAEARAMFEKAQAQYDLTHYDLALGGFERAFEIKPLPGFLFNIGQCHRELHHWGKAEHFYRTYLERQPAARNHALVESLITEMQEQQRREEAGVRPPLSAEEGARRALAPDDALAVAAPPSRPLPVWKRWYFWTALGAGLVVAGAAVTVGVAAANPRLSTPEGTLGAIDAR